VSHIFSVSHYSRLARMEKREREADDSYAGWIGTVGAAHEGVPHPTLDDAASRLAAIAGTSTCHIAQSKEGILVPGVVSLHILLSPPTPFCPVPIPFILLAPLEKPSTSFLSLSHSLSRVELTTSGDHTETQSSQDYG
jgi:hypothetical protein